MNDFLFAQVLTDLEDAVGRENCSVREIDKLTHSVDYFWLSRMWADRGRRMPEADFIVSPKDAQETSKVVKIANYYRIPVTAWGGGGGTQGGAIPVCGGILLDTKRMDRIYEINEEGMYIECGAGTVYKHLEWAAIDDTVLHTYDAPLVSFGENGICKYWASAPRSRKAVFCVNLFNNHWGTNFPQWIEGDVSYEFILNKERR